MRDKKYVKDAMWRKEPDRNRTGTGHDPDRPPGLPAAWRGLLKDYRPALVEDLYPAMEPKGEKIKWPTNTTTS